MEESEIKGGRRYWGGFLEVWKHLQRTWSEIWSLAWWTLAFFPWTLLDEWLQNLELVPLCWLVSHFFVQLIFFLYISLTSLNSVAVAQLFFSSFSLFSSGYQFCFFSRLLSKCTQFIIEVQHLKMDDHASFIKAHATRRQDKISCKQV